MYYISEPAFGVYQKESRRIRLDDIRHKPVFGYDPSNQGEWCKECLKFRFYHWREKWELDKNEPCDACLDRKFKEKFIIPF